MEKWCKLKKITFLKILNQTVNEKEYKVDTNKLKFDNLENSNFYLICGEEGIEINEFSENNIFYKLIIYIFNLFHFYLKNVLNFLFSEFWW